VIVATMALDIGASFAMCNQMPPVRESVSSILATLPISTPCNSTSESTISPETGSCASIRYVTYRAEERRYQPPAASPVTPRPCHAKGRNEKQPCFPLKVI
jgi:hypothetical protein